MTASSGSFSRRLAMCSSTAPAGWPGSGVRGRLRRVDACPVAGSVGRHGFISSPSLAPGAKVRRPCRARDSSGPGEASGGLGTHDHFQPPFQAGNMPATAGGRRGGRSGSGSRDKFNGRQQCGRISPGSPGHRPDDPGITTLFLGLAQARRAHQTTGCHQYNPATINSSQRTQWSRRFRCASSWSKSDVRSSSPIAAQSSDGTSNRGRPPIAQSIGGTRPGTRQTVGRRLNPIAPASSSVWDCNSPGTGRTSCSRR